MWWSIFLRVKGLLVCHRTLQTFKEAIGVTKRSTENQGAVGVTKSSSESHGAVGVTKHDKEQFWSAKGLLVSEWLVLKVKEAIAVTINSSES